MAEPIKTLRCAVYTRKSTDEGLDMDFNSLQAQREACEAFIRSQRGEGWKLIPTAYDDGGISGGTMERPALQRLLAAIEAGLIDVVVVYKVDRLTRSLSDFSKMVEVFDRRGISFVAVTQQFNTTTSMGRLTLNVLLSFAQFEREVTAERIRDKVAASKRKGIWMGGGLPQGYRVEDRKLIVVPEQAAIVNAIYRKYLECWSIRELSLELKRDGITALSSTRPSKKSGGPALTVSRGALYALLSNPIYVGLIRHKKELYPGQHEGIVDRGIWDAVQEKLEASRRCRGRPRRKTEESLLLGKLFDEQARPLTPIHTIRRGKRYRYYVSHTDDRDEDRLHQRSVEPWSLPAAEMEQRASELVADMVADQAGIVEAATAAGMTGVEVESLLREGLHSGRAQRLEWVERIDLGQEVLRVAIRLPGRVGLRLERSVSVQMKRRGVERRLVLAPREKQASQADPRIVRILGLGLRFWEQLRADQAMTARQFAEKEGVDARFLGRAFSLAFMAPDLIERFATGQHPVEWTAERLIRWDPLPLSWEEQRRVVGAL